MADVEQVGPYRLVRRLGAGSYGTTYLAEDPFGGSVALKRLTYEGEDYPEARERFARELEAARRINSQFLARLIDFDLEDSPPWIAFAYISGRDLTDVMYEAPLPETRVRRIAVQLAMALRDLRDHDVVHRDLKPANIRVGANDSITVVDLGIAWDPDLPGLTKTGYAMGTLEYMPPESHRDLSRPTFAWDTWGLGLIVAKLAGGAHPFGYAMSNPARFISAVLNEEPDLGSVPSPWRQICERCLARQPEDRPNLEMLIRALSRWRFGVLGTSEGPVPVLRASIAGVTTGSRGPGGWGAFLQDVQIPEMWGTVADTTTNRMVLTAAIAVAEALDRPALLVLETDSSYLLEVVSDRLARWKRGGWRTAEGRQVKNADLWKRLDLALRPHAVFWRMCKPDGPSPELARARDLAEEGMARLV